MISLKKTSTKNHDNLSELLGKRIRELRKGKKYRLLDLAKETGLTSSMISQVENASISPSIETLKKIGNALDVPVSYFFVDETAGTSESESETQVSNTVFEQSPVVHEHKRKILSPGKGVTYYLLNPNLDGPIEFIYNIYEPGSSTGEGYYNHIGHECGLILEGELLVHIRDKQYLLKKGDSITFQSTEPHLLKNIGDCRCVCVWANTPPHF